jgi:hypothetical protein
MAVTFKQTSWILEAFSRYIQLETNERLSAVLLKCKSTAKARINHFKGFCFRGTICNLSDRQKPFKNIQIYDRIGKTGNLKTSTLAFKLSLVAPL